MITLARCFLAKSMQRLVAPRSMHHVAALLLAAALSCMGSTAHALVFSNPPTEQDIFRAHLFEEPLVPIGGKPSVAENQALASALTAYAARTSNDEVSALTGFLATHPASPWRVALLTDLGIVYYHTGHYSKSLDAWQQAADAGKATPHPLVDRALGELARMHARLGHVTEIQTLLGSLGGRELTGPGHLLLDHAKEGLWQMENRPDLAFRCGPFALQRLRASLHLPPDERVNNAPSTAKGTSLAFIAGLAKAAGMDLRPVKREDPNAAPPLPCIVHWKVGHYAALVKTRGGRTLSQDPTFADEVWLSPAALADEASGYFLIPGGVLPAGWLAVEDAEAQGVWGMGDTGKSDPNGTSKGDPTCADCDKGSAKGMANYRFHTMLASLSISDTPVGYTPPRGPAIDFSVTYNQREANQPAVFSYSNLGVNWAFNWLSYITDDPGNVFASVTCYLAGGGTNTFDGFDPATSSFAPEIYSHDLLKRTSPTSYESTSADGSRMVFNLPDGAASFPRKLFLTQMIDRAGNVVQIGYDANFRIATITDAIGQVTTLSYANASDIFKITRVTDPFGRFAGFDYDASDNLVLITDEIGLTSHFVYNGNFINKLTTPYGDTTFDTGVSGRTSFVEATDPDGGKKRVEYNERSDIAVASDPAPLLPQGMLIWNAFMYTRNSYYWDRKAMKDAPGDYRKARQTHWLHQASTGYAGRMAESQKAPLENRIRFNYPGQTQDSDLLAEGTSNRPTKIGRVLDDGTTQLYQYEYNTFSNVTRAVDPLGRTTAYIYDENGIDLLEVRQINGAANDLLETRTYNGQHLPLTVTDTAGQTTVLTYNPHGQPLTSTNAKGEITTAIYDANSYLHSIDGPLPGVIDTFTFTYDTFGRVQTETDPEGYVLTYEYDALDRPTKITYPNGKTDSWGYDKLDRASATDRLHRTTTYEYDAVRQLSKITDPLGRVTHFEWCRCGAMKKLIDPLGRATTWSHDILGRQTAKTFADGSAISYRYENTTSRLQATTDAKGQTKNYRYFGDDRLRQISYTNAGIATPAVSFTYDPIYPRVTSMSDGSGGTAYTYNPVTAAPALGANRLATIDGPLTNDTIAFNYDELGRVLGRSIGSAAQSRTYDPAGRIGGVANPLGAFIYGYVNGTNRLASVTLPNGQTEARAYFDNNGDQMLRQISHLRPDMSTLSQFDYTYNAVREIATWSQQRGAATAGVLTPAYDLADQVTGVSATNPSRTYGYGYDAAGNRLSEAIDANTVSAGFSPLNTPVSYSAPVESDRTYEWDAEDRLVAINYTGSNLRTEFGYDGRGRRIRILEKNGATVTNEKRFVWCDFQLCEERDGNDAVTRRFFPQGVAVANGPQAGNYFYTRDHLDSVTDVTDAAGAPQAAYAYDPWGRRTKLSGGFDADFGFAGYYQHAPSALGLAPLRGYDANLGRWLNRDPIGEAGGVNLYAYVGNRPLSAVDPLGLCLGREDDAYRKLVWSIADERGERGLSKERYEYLKKLLDAARERLARLERENGRYGNPFEDIQSDRIKEKNAEEALGSEPWL